MEEKNWQSKSRCEKTDAQGCVTVVVVELRFRSGRGLLSTVPDDNRHLGGMLKNSLLYHLREGTKIHKAESAGFTKLSM